MQYTSYQPEGFRGKSDSRLPHLVKQLERLLANTQRKLSYDTLRLDKEDREELAGVLVDFAVDIHNGIGIWEAYEQYNIEFFGTPLPLTTNEQPEGIDVNRIQHLLWIIYPEMIPNILLAPSHTDLQRVALAAWDFLKDKIPSLPQDSGIKVFLGTANDYGWDVKRKLVWLATNSYMFRLFYGNYIFDHNDGKWDIGHTDDFICQECTRWSGLGAIDILARVLDITDDERKELRSWYERLAALYLLKSVSNETIEALNVINETKYRIRLNVDRQPFKEGQLVFGSLTSWKGEWYWSGGQQTFDKPSEKQIDDFRNTMRRNSSHIVCRYHKEYEKLVRERAADYHNFMMNYYGKDLIIYPDGLSMAADWEKELRTNWESKPPEKVKEAIERHDLKGGKPNMPLPDDLLESKNGLAVFINPDEGKEIVKEYNSIVSGMRKRGEGMTEDEEVAIRGFIFANAISPAFVKRVVCKFGDESIKAAFVLGKCADIYWLEYLLRSLKGIFYRKRYPSFSVI